MLWFIEFRQPESNRLAGLSPPEVPRYAVSRATGPQPGKGELLARDLVRGQLTQSRARSQQDTVILWDTLQMAASTYRVAPSVYVLRAQEVLIR